ncbi:MAG TPA: acyltransferase [Candidatus Elarobacter sp.]|jgi:peptidoglycan/LPS O-acetylase OafA/YrhL
MSATPSANRAYFPHVEGLRGAAALYVFLYHIWSSAAEDTAGLVRPWFTPTLFMQYGHFAVAAFIVISGYCLALPVAMRPERAFGVMGFFKRRARRLMPAYLLVLFASVLLYCLTAVLNNTHINAGHIAVGLALHVALIHNLFAASNEYLNGPMWSIALEVQIYVVFALLLIPVWRRFGVAAQLAVALVLGVLPHYLLHRFDWTAPWLLGLFAMGVAAAHLTARPDLARWPWMWISGGTAVVALLALLPYRDQVTSDGVILLMDVAVGVAIAAFFVAAARHERFVGARVFSTRALLVLGSFSYSLYLVHAPLLRVFAAALARAHTGTVFNVVAYVAFVPFVIGVAYAVYRVAERPFFSAFARETIDAHRAEVVLAPDAPDVPGASDAPDAALLPHRA